MEDIHDRTLETCTVTELLQRYQDHRPYSSDSVNELQRCYDKSLEVLDTINMEEINLLWQLRHLPFYHKSMICEFVSNNYKLWSYHILQPIDIPRYGKIDFEKDKFKTTDK